MFLFLLDLVLTIVLEFCVHKFLIRAEKWQVILVFGVLLNGLTFPLAQMFIFEWGWPLLAVEGGIFVAEAIIISLIFKELGRGRAVLISLVANGFSWGLGTLLYVWGII